MYRTERVFIVTALLAAGLTLVVAVRRGMVGVEEDQFGALLWLMCLAIMLVAAVGALWVRTSVEAGSHGAALDVRLPLLTLPAEIVVPSLLAAASFAFIQLFDSAVLQGVVLLFVAGGFAGVYWAQVHTRHTEDAYFALAQATLNVGSHLTAFLLFSVVYGAKVRSLFSASAAGVVAALLLFELLSRDAAWHRALGLPVEGRRTTLGLLSLAGGLLVAELMWGLNYWAALSTLIGGAFLFVVFYIVHGLASHYVDRNLSRQLLVEYGIVGAVGLGAVFASAFFS